MEAPEDLLVRAQVQPWKIEESNGVAMANIEEEVRRAFVIGILKDIGQGKCEEVLVELYSPLNVGAELRHMGYAACSRWWRVGIGPQIRGVALRWVASADGEC